MDKEARQDIIDKYKDRHEAAIKYISANGERAVESSVDRVLQLVEEGKIPSELGDWWKLKCLEDDEEKRRMTDFFTNHPELTDKEKIEKFLTDRSPEEIEKRAAKFYEDAFLSTQLHMHLLAAGLDNCADATHSLFNGFSADEEFGVSNCIANALFHLEELLKNMKAESPCKDNSYEAKSRIENARGEAISLSYSFPASSQEEADAILKKYKTAMISKGLRCLLAHWAMATKIGRTEYGCPMIEIMKLMADEHRSSIFSVKEKEEHWKLTKMCGVTRLSRERMVKKRGTCTEAIRWVEQSLIEIVGGEKEMTAEDKYPSDIAVRVLMPRMDRKTKGFSPARFAVKTLQLAPIDTYLALIFQIRATQMQRGAKELHFDWDFIIEKGGLHTTSISNNSVAKVNARKKMERLQEAEVMENWSEDLLGVCVVPKKPKEKKGNDVKKNT